jgi:hypothetical protein
MFALRLITVAGVVLVGCATHKFDTRIGDIPPILLDKEQKANFGLTSYVEFPAGQYAVEASGPEGTYYRSPTRAIVGSYLPGTDQVPTMGGIFIPVRVTSTLKVSFWREHPQTRMFIRKPLTTPVEYRVGTTSTVK